MPRFDMTTIGEALLRLSVPAGVRLEAADRLDLSVGGAEVNTACGLARLGRSAAWCGSLPQNALGRRVAEHLRSAGTDTQPILWRETGRLGTYYVEFAVPPRAALVTYDRAGSTITELTEDDLDWDSLLDTRIIHLTGITPAISPSCRELCATVVQRAREESIPVSFDVNFRSKLWRSTAARSALMPLINGAEVLFCSAADAQTVFGLKGYAEDNLSQLMSMTGARAVVMSRGDKGVIARDGSAVLSQPAMPVTILDRIGAGDALAAGVLHGWLNGDLALGLRCGTAMAALVLSQYGDSVITTLDEVQRLIDDSSSAPPTVVR